MTATNKVVLDLTDNEELRDAVAKLAPGDSVTMKVTASLDEATGGKRAVFSVTDAEVDEPLEDAAAPEDSMGEELGAMPEVAAPGSGE